MAFKELNTYGDLATHYQVSEDTIRRWIKFWSYRMSPKLAIKRCSGRTHYIIKSEAERLDLAMDVFWDDREVFPKRKARQQRTSGRSSRRVK
jgi:transposase